MIFVWHKLSYHIDWPNQLSANTGSSIPQLKTSTYSKPTDIHHYIPPSSCTPNLSSKSPDLLIAFINFSGYLQASGYDKTSIITFFTDMLKVSNRSVAFKIKEPDTSFKIPLVTKLHPALPNPNKIFDQFYSIIKDCPFSSTILPRESIMSAHRKLPPLSSILASNPFNILHVPASPKGFHQTPGC